MKKTRLAIPFIVLLFFVITIASYINVNNTRKNPASHITKHITKNKIENINMDVDTTGPIYNDMDTIIKDSDIIVQGTVLNASYFDKGFRTYTKSQVKVTKSYNKSINNGDIITFIELGGITTQQ